MIANIRYLWYVLRHKYFVFLAGLKLKVPIWQLLIHDFSKFGKDEWTPYVHIFYRSDLRGSDDVKARFKVAVQHHYDYNPHHWQYYIQWVDGVALPIPDVYIREMIADWLGAGRVQNGHWNIGEWYDKSKDKMNLHPQTRATVESLILNHI